MYYYQRVVYARSFRPYGGTKKCTRTAKIREGFRESGNQLLKKKKEICLSKLEKRVILYIAAPKLCLNSIIHYAVQ